jgi:hypothetical protein
MTVAAHIVSVMRTLTNSDAASGRSPRDALLAYHAFWREQSLAVALAYRHWTDSDRAERGAAYHGYLVALDREGHAARMYADEAERIR